MKLGPNSSTEDVMTPERLRKHWFGGKRVPFWNYDPAQLTIGVEIEYFIARVKPSGFELATKNQYLEVIRHLCSDFGYSDHDLKDQPGRVSKDTSNGFIAIKPDFAWHILEIALPPRNLVSDIKNLLESTFAQVDAALAKVGLERLDMSCLPDVPEKMELVALDRLSGYHSHGKDHVLNDALAVFPALITATHIHANCSSEESLILIPELYKLDDQTKKKFSRAKQFKGKVFENVRDVFYEKAFGDQYLLRTTPVDIPNSIHAYVGLLNRSPKIFPNDPFFGSRDMSYIRPTRHGTMEFRSTCSYKQVSVLIEIVEARISQILAASSMRTRAGA